MGTKSEIKKHRKALCKCKYDEFECECVVSVSVSKDVSVNVNVLSMLRLRAVHLQHMPKQTAHCQTMRPLQISTWLTS